MIEVEWHYKHEGRRVLVVLPPLPLEARSTLLKQPEFLRSYRKTINALCQHETMEYVFIHIPHLDPNDYDQRCLVEDIYGREVRLVKRLRCLLDRRYPDTMTAECVYMLQRPDEWMNSDSPVEWYIDLLVEEHLYKHYDPISIWLSCEMQKFIDVIPGSRGIYESCLMLLNLTEPREKDLVLFLGDIEESHQSRYTTLIRELVEACRIRAIYSLGNMTPWMKDLKPVLDSVPYTLPYEFYTTSVLSSSKQKWMESKLQSYSPVTLQSMVLGSWTLENTETPFQLSKKHVGATFFSTEAWSSLYPDQLYPPMPRVGVADITYEPLGLWTQLVDHEKET